MLAFHESRAIVGRGIARISRGLECYGQMPIPPEQPKIYHITHIDNLPSIVSGGILSDSAMIAKGGPIKAVGMSKIKLRRLQELRVDCHVGDFVGQYVPFYFCPRSIMLYLLYMGNSPELTYRGGQGHIVHLEADLGEVVAYANRTSTRWAFSLSNAGAYYTEFRKDLANLNEINWPAVAATNFKPPDIKEGKQAEFLVRDYFPWKLVTRIGVQSQSIAQRAHAALGASQHRPVVEIQPSWYF
jgi:hypothetical protein